MQRLSRLLLLAAVALAGLAAPEECARARKGPLPGLEVRTGDFSPRGAGPVGGVAGAPEPERASLRAAPTVRLPLSAGAPGAPSAEDRIGRGCAAAAGAAPPCATPGAWDPQHTRPALAP